MRWLLLPLMLLAAGGGYFVAVRKHAAWDRRGTSGAPRPAAVERLLRILDDRKTPPLTPVEPRLSNDEHGHPWVKLLEAKSELADRGALWDFAEEHDGTAPGARALQLWTQHGLPQDRAYRRAIFRKRYPRSWILKAWDAEERR